MQPMAAPTQTASSISSQAFAGMPTAAMTRAMADSTAPAQIFMITASTIASTSRPQNT